MKMLTKFFFDLYQYLQEHYYTVGLFIICEINKVCILFFQDNCDTNKRKFNVDFLTKVFTILHDTNFNLGLTLLLCKSAHCLEG